MKIWSFSDKAKYARLRTLPDPFGMSDSLVHSRQKCRALPRFYLRLLSQPSADSACLVPKRRYQRSIKSFSLFLNEAQFRQATSHPQTKIRHLSQPNAAYYTIFPTNLQSPSPKIFIPLPRPPKKKSNLIHSCVKAYERIKKNGAGSRAVTTKTME